MLLYALRSCLLGAWVCLGASGCGWVGVKLLVSASTQADAGPPAACACENEHGNADCSSGSCVIACAANYADCDGLAANGCEVDLASSPLDCGACGNACAASNAAASCKAGTCTVSSCGPGFADCDGRDANGCESDLSSTSAHCGACAIACSNAHGANACTASHCVPSCAKDFADCDGNPNNGCETSLTSIRNCGACGSVCPAEDTGAVATCNAGTCGTTCSFSGRWAARLDAQLTWTATAVLSAGSGTNRYWSQLDLVQGNGALTGSSVLCGTEVAGFATALGGGERFEAVFPNTLFDHSPALLPSSAVSITLDGAMAGASFTLAPFASLRGVQLADPLNDPWPVSPLDLMTVDADQDDEVAVTALYTSDLVYRYPALDLLRAARADRGYIAERIVHGASGTIRSCSQAEGTGQVTVEVHTVGCHVAGGGNCQRAQANVLDTHGPHYLPGIATYTLVRVADDADCAAVRAALP